MGNAGFKRHYYQISKVFATVKHYELTKGNHNSLLTERIKFTKDRAFSNASGQLFWLHLREPKKWGKQVTGLRPIRKDEVFYGDIQKPNKALLLFQFSNDGNNLVVDVFPSFYPTHKGILRKITETHPYYIK